MLVKVRVWKHRPTKCLQMHTFKQSCSLVSKSKDLPTSTIIRCKQLVIDADKMNNLKVSICFKKIWSLPYFLLFWISNQFFAIKLLYWKLQKSILKKCFSAIVGVSRFSTSSTCYIFEWMILFIIKDYEIILNENFYKYLICEKLYHNYLMY